jgi:hypothetical protein
MMGRKAGRNMYSRIPIKLEFSAFVGFIHKESVFLSILARKVKRHSDAYLAHDALYTRVNKNPSA